MLPVDARDELKLPGHTSRFMDGRFPDYMRRLCDFRQMDFEATFDQMLTLLSFEPSKVYVSFYYRKQTKNQWARDDPAFMVVEAAFVAVSQTTKRIFLSGTSCSILLQVHPLHYS